jgi:ABC-type transport system involved in cytochrome bd biosynthesis fused ATPase/permease subunit
MLLDEPTNMLDTKSELAFLKKLKSLASDRIVLVVSHRLATVMAANIVHVLEDGRITESDSPSNLTGRKGVFHKLFPDRGEDRSD